MENASKALIIAGAILLVIAIIAIAVGIVSKTRGAMDVAGGQIDSMAVEMHNNIFQKYEGKDKSYAEVRECISEISSYNNSNNNSNLEIQIGSGAYNDASHTAYGMCCTMKIATHSFSGVIGCSWLNKPTEKIHDKKWDIIMEYNSNGVIKFISFIRHDREV